MNSLMAVNKNRWEIKILFMYFKLVNAFYRNMDDYYVIYYFESSVDGT